MVSATDISPHTATVCKKVVELLFCGYPHREFSVRLGEEVILPVGQCGIEKFSIVIRDPSVLRRIILHPNSLSVGESYVEGGWDVEGDIRELFSLVDYLVERHFSNGERLALFGYAMSLPKHHKEELPGGANLHGRQHDIERDAEAVRFHYDLPTEFYRLWLDRNMQYSAACFDSPFQSLDEAQEAKLELICHRLRLTEGEQFLDIGCGWGGLIVHAAKFYRVKARGITLSKEQAEYAAGWIATEGLSDLCEVALVDYRELECPEMFDKIASIGMIEHVGEGKLQTYFGKIFSLLKPGGLFLNSGITVPATEHRFKGNPFVEKYVFPDGDVIPFGNVLEHAEKAGLEERGDLNLRDHYGLALDHWSKRLERNAAAAKRIVGDEVYRVFRLYLAGCAQSFKAGRNQVHQTLFAKPLV